MQQPLSNEAVLLSRKKNQESFIRWAPLLLNRLAYGDVPPRSFDRENRVARYPVHGNDAFCGQREIF